MFAKRFFNDSVRGEQISKRLKINFSFEHR